MKGHKRPNLKGLNTSRVQIQQVDEKHILIRKEKVEDFATTVEDIQRNLLNNLNFLITLLDAVEGLKGTVLIYRLFKEKIEKYRTLGDMLRNKDQDTEEPKKEG